MSRWALSISLTAILGLSTNTPAVARDVVTTAVGQPGPSLRLTYPSESRFSAARLTVEVTDPAGLAAVEILDRADDLRYQTEPARTGPATKFTRSFSLSEIFPAAPAQPGTLRLEVIVRNTKGQSTSATAVIRLEK